MTAGDTAVRFAITEIGKPYKFGATGPDSYDCSGLVMRAYEAAGYKWKFRPVVHTILPLGVEVAKAELAPGDAVMPSPAHVQIYAGNGMIVEAAHTGTNVRLVPMWGFWRARRLLEAGTITDPSGVTPYPEVKKPWEDDDPIKQLTNVFAGYAKVAGWLQDVHNWQRIGMVIAGLILCAIGIVGATRMQKAAQSVTTAATKVVNT